MFRLATTVAGIVALASGYSEAHAEVAASNFHLSGFGTLGVAHSSERNADFVTSGLAPNGAGFTRDWDMNPDSKLGGQVDAQYGDSISATAQLLVHQRYDSTDRPELMMAFAKWRATGDLSVRAGRLAIPVFLISDYRYVGYSQTTLRPPEDFYKPFAFSHYDGADITLNETVASVALKGQVYAGTMKANGPAGLDAKSGAIFGANLTADTGDLTLRVSYLLASKTTLTSPQVSAAFQAVRVGLPAGALFPGSPAVAADPTAANEYEYKDKDLSYTSAAVNYDTGNWFVTSELSLTSSTAFVGKVTRGYVTAGLRLGKFTPYATVQQIKTARVGPSGSPLIDALATSTAQAGERTGGVGLRWDALKNVDVKVQFDRSSLYRGSHGQLANVQSGFQPGHHYNIASAAVDFVF